MRTGVRKEPGVVRSSRPNNNFSSLIRETNGGLFWGALIFENYWFFST
jgi:hypothetical protein